MTLSNFLHMAEMTLGQRIRWRRRELAEERGGPVSQATLAGELGVSQQTVARWEQDEAQPRYLEDWDALAELLGVPVAELTLAAGIARTPDVERLPIEERLELVRAAVVAMTEVLEGLRKEVRARR